jgi:hypothetical protein
MNYNKYTKAELISKIKQPQEKITAKTENSITQIKWVELFTFLKS